MLDILDSEQVDRHLSSGPFGSSEYLSANVELLYKNLSSMFGRELGFDVPAPAASLPPTFRAIIRRELDFSFAELTEGRSVSNQDRWRHVIQTINCGTVDFAHEQVGPISVLADWDNDRTAEDIRQTFRRSMLDEGAQIKGRRPAKKHLHVIKQAHELATHTIPNTYFGTLMLAPNVVLVRGQVSSAYINENPYSFIVNESQLTDQALAMETLLHEALHEKMACIRLTSNLLQSGYDDMDSETRGDVLVPWPTASKPRYWSFARALAAYHVYFHTSALYILLLRNQSALTSVEADVLLKRFKLQYERAYYLHSALRSERCLSFSDVDAANFFAWADVILASIADVRDLSLPAIQTWSHSDLRIAEDSRRAA